MCDRATGRHFIWCVLLDIRQNSSILSAMGCFKRTTGDEEEKLRKETNKKIERQLQKDKQLYRATHRLLLLGKFALTGAYRVPFPI